MRNCLLTISLFIICFSSLQLQATPGDIPVALKRQLATYREKDSLEAWIYARIGYADEAPEARIDFLMQTQAAAWRTYRTYKERLAWFDLLVLQGYYQLQTGNILASINAYEKALQFYESYPLPDAEADLVENVLKPLGNNYTRLADYTTALYIQQKTLTQAVKQNDVDLIASTYSNMAISARWKGDLVVAAGYCREGLKKVRSGAALQGLLLSTYADILIEQANYDTARIACVQAVKILDRHQRDDAALYWHIGALQVASRIEWQQEKFQPAKNYAARALYLLQQHFPRSKPREKAKVHVLLGDIALRSGDAAASLASYQLALGLLIPSFQPATLSAMPPEEAIYSENTIADALAGKAFAFMQLQKNENALSHFLMAFAAQRKLGREFFHVVSRFRELEVTRSRAEAAMECAYRLWKTTGNRKYLDQLLLVAELSKAQVLVDERAARDASYVLPDSLAVKEKQLQQTIGYYQRELIATNNKAGLRQLLLSAEYELALLQKNNKTRDAGQILSADRLQKMLGKIPPGIVMLEFFAGRDSSYLLEFGSSGTQSVQLITKKQVQEDIRHFMQKWFYGSPVMINEPELFYAECYSIYTAVFGNYVWQPGKRYTLIPDGNFNYLPFDALVTDKKYTGNYANWPYLFKRISISLAYSVQVWSQQQSTRYPSNPFNGFFISGPAQQQGFLAVQKEHAMLQQELKGGFYLDRDASWSQLDHTINASGILHFSTHGFSVNKDSFPKLELYDRPFYLFDLQYKNFSTALVVLSACETADGSLIEGEGVNSLSRGFTAAGAGGVVAGLWKVNDAAAIEIMRSFYRHLSQDDPAAALHKAKADWLTANKDQAAFQLPYYWAGFVYTGSLQPVSIDRAGGTESILSWWLTGCVCIVCISLVYFIYKATLKKA